ncbi:hypothetical protein [Tengunoibacter tsumagoiensis]|uniref:Uncharacterized protein n=1 Tax=Tengunoibacter tsumagoiensis TaxID=2014871 RepID=A0A402A2H8_9CHLR|nr:hypothetical protein [Tengunoibacter tsumagoiensis]GCE13358.1 hypothetical protein KTT_32170 [Tengunoibacter tsumagoiensis]
MNTQTLTIKQLWLLALEICLGLLIVALILEMAIDHPAMLTDLLPTRPFELINLILVLLSLFIGGAAASALGFAGAKARKSLCLDRIVSNIEACLLRGVTFAMVFKKPRGVIKNFNDEIKNNILKDLESAFNRDIILSFFKVFVYLFALLCVISMIVTLLVILIKR